jgi:hypothetical protein
METEDRCKRPFENRIGEAQKRMECWGLGGDRDRMLDFTVERM